MEPIKTSPAFGLAKSVLVVIKDLLLDKNRLCSVLSLDNHDIVIVTDDYTVVIDMPVTSRAESEE